MHAESDHLRDNNTMTPRNMRSRPPHARTTMQPHDHQLTARIARIETVMHDATHMLNQGRVVERHLIAKDGHLAFRALQQMRRHLGEQKRAGRPVR